MVSPLKANERPRKAGTCATKVASRTAKHRKLPDPAPDTKSSDRGPFEAALVETKAAFYVKRARCKRIQQRLLPLKPRSAIGELALCFAIPHPQVLRAIQPPAQRLLSVLSSRASEMRSSLRAGLARDRLGLRRDLFALKNNVAIPRKFLSAMISRALCSSSSMLAYLERGERY